MLVWSGGLLSLSSNVVSARSAMTLCLQVQQGWGLQHLSWTMVGSALLSQHWLACIMSEVANLPQFCLPSCYWHCPSCHVGSAVHCFECQAHAADLQSLLDDMRTPSSLATTSSARKPCMRPATDSIVGARLCGRCPLRCSTPSLAHSASMQEDCPSP